MADNKKIPGLTEATTAALTDEAVLAVSGLARRMSLTNLKTVLGILPSFQGALVKLTSDEALASGAVLAIPWDAEVYDEGGWWTSGAATRLTVPTGVTRVRLTGTVAIVSGLTADRFLVRLQKNDDASATLQVAQDLDPITGGPVLSISSPVLTVVAGDFFELEAFQDSGGSVDIDAVGASSETRSFFGIEAVN